MVGEVLKDRTAEPRKPCQYQGYAYGNTYRSNGQKYPQNALIYAATPPTSQAYSSDIKPYQSDRTTMQPQLVTCESVKEQNDDEWNKETERRRRDWWVRRNEWNASGKSESATPDFNDVPPGVSTGEEQATGRGALSVHPYRKPVPTAVTKQPCSLSADGSLAVPSDSGLGRVMDTDSLVPFSDIGAKSNSGTENRRETDGSGPELAPLTKGRVDQETSKSGGSMLRQSTGQITTRIPIQNVISTPICTEKSAVGLVRGNSGSSRPVDSQAEDSIVEPFQSVVRSDPFVNLVTTDATRSENPRTNQRGGVCKASNADVLKQVSSSDVADRTESNRAKDKNEIGNIMPAIGYEGPMNLQPEEKWNLAEEKKLSGDQYGRVGGLTFCKRMSETVLKKKNAPLNNLGSAMASVVVSDTRASNGMTGNTLNGNIVIPRSRMYRRGTGSYPNTGQFDTGSFGSASFGGFDSMSMGNGAHSSNWNFGTSAVDVPPLGNIGDWRGHFKTGGSWVGNQRWVTADSVGKPIANVNITMRNYGKFGASSPSLKGVTALDLAKCQVGAPKLVQVNVDNNKFVNDRQLEQLSKNGQRLLGAKISPRRIHGWSRPVSNSNPFYNTCPFLP